MKKIVTILGVLFGLLIAASVCVWLMLSTMSKIETMYGYLRLVPLNQSWCGLSHDPDSNLVMEDMKRVNAPALGAMIDPDTCRDHPELIGKYVSVLGERVACDSVKPKGSTDGITNVTCLMVDEVEAQN